MNTTVTPFVFEGASIRALEIDGEPYFVGKDVAATLGYVDTTNAMKQHCRGVAKHHPIPDALGRMQETRVLSEPDMLRLIVNSALPAAERFERWVFEDVLPSIRKTGAYAVPRTQAEMLLASAQALVDMERKQAELQQDVARIESRVDDLAESRVWDHCPQNCEPITKIEKRMNERYALPAWVIDLVVRQLPLSPKPYGMVRNQREEAMGSQYAVYAVADITRIFAHFVSECVQETPTRWSHRDIDRDFQLLPSGRRPKQLKAHAKPMEPA